jgi:hypothetical protein
LKKWHKSILIYGTLLFFGNLVFDSALGQTQPTPMVKIVPNYGEEFFLALKLKIPLAEKNRILSLIGVARHRPNKPGNWYRIKITNGMKADEAIAFMLKEPSVEWAHLIYPYSYPLPGVVEVDFKPNVLNAEKTKILNSIGTINKPISQVPNTHYVVTITNGITVGEAIKKLSKDPNVLVAEAEGATDSDPEDWWK